MWVRPSRWWRSLSTACRVDPLSRRRALRFARVKPYRDDKTADEADTIGAVRELLPPGQA